MENIQSVIEFYISTQKQLGGLYAQTYEAAKDGGDPGCSMIVTLEQGAKQRIENGEADKEQVQIVGKKVMDILDPLGIAGDIPQDVLSVRQPASLQHPLALPLQDGATHPSAFPQP